jgi:hypothetical protein
MGDRLAAADFDGDNKVDLAIAVNDKVARVRERAARRARARASRGAGCATTAARSARSSRSAPGGIYRRIYWRGEPEIIGVGDAPRIDVLRLTWPNGVVTTRLDIEITPQGMALDPDEALGVLTQGMGSRPRARSSTPGTDTRSRSCPTCSASRHSACA